MMEKLKKYRLLFIIVLVIAILLNYKMLFNMNKIEKKNELEENQKNAKEFAKDINSELEDVLKSLEKQNSSLINQANVPDDDKIKKIENNANLFEEKRDDKLASDVLNNSSLANGNSTRNPCKNNCW